MKQFPTAMDSSQATRTRRILDHLRPMPSSAPEVRNGLRRFNALPRRDLLEALYSICNCHDWANQVADGRPYDDIAGAVSAATQSWFSLGPTGWKEAFAGHGTLGAKVAEQKEEMARASRGVVLQIETANVEYEAKHGHKCITFAAGKSPERLLLEVLSRTPKTVEEEFRRCAEQTMLISALRLCRFVEPASISEDDILVVSPVTTHILDTSLGLPAKGVTIRMEFEVAPSRWIPVGTGVTNSDGRVTDLLPGFYDTLSLFQRGTYRITFDVAGYYNTLNAKAFYPEAVICFVVEDPSQHFHIPLLLNPYGYSTYRGS